MPILANVIQDAFSPLISLFEWVLVHVHDDVLGGSWGLSIIGLTIVVRAIMVPLTFRQFRSMQNMQRLAPEIKALQAKFKDDKQRQQQELMNFYRENKVNPFASCLPLLLQLPVFISLFYMLRTDLKLDICGAAMRNHFHVAHNSEITGNSHFSSQLSSLSCSMVPGGHGLAKFWFIPDITHQASGVVLVVLLVLYVGSQLMSTLMMSATADANQRRMMMALPLVFTLFIFRFPAGLLVYWITTNLWTMGQQYFVRRRVGPPPPRDGVVESSATGRSQPALAGALAGGGASTPPPSARKKKKRSGRRR
jgi:YidC/Oxa1 family membrane protein insertase